MVKSKLQKLIEEKNQIKSSKLEKEVVASLLDKVKVVKGDPGADGRDGEHGKDGHTPTKTELLALIKPLIPETPKEVHGKDGKSIKGEKGEPGKDGRDGRDGRDAILPSLYDLAINTVNVIEQLKGEDRIDYRAIKGLEELIKRLVYNETVGVGYGGPSVGIQLANTWNEEYPNVGTVNGVNTVFSFVHTPAIISLEGQTLSLLNGDYIISGNKITLANPPQGNPPINKYLS